MEFKEYFDLESFIFSLIDDFKYILSPELWGNASVLLDFSKNEILALLLLRRQKEVNISEIAEYINAPLNTVTGIVGRLEKKLLIERMRNNIDRRVVNIVLTQQGKEMMDREIAYIGGYVKDLYSQLTEAEKAAAMSIFGKVMNTFRQKSGVNSVGEERKIKRIIIE